MTKLLDVNLGLTKTFVNHICQEMTDKSFCH